MSWRVCFVALVSVYVMLVSGSKHPVHAAEAYVCGPDTITYVEVKDLERMKRTDPCIGAYYGLSVGAAAPVEAPAEQLNKKQIQPNKADAVMVDLKPRSDPDITQRPERKTYHQASLNAPIVAAPGADYRNVRVINASSPDAAWFRHGK